MARLVNRLKPVQLRSLKPGLHPDGNGLYIFVSESGAKSWRLILNINGKRRELGLGPMSAVSLSEARYKRDEALKLRQQGLDPLQVWRGNGANGNAITFGTVAKEFIALHEPTWKNEKHRNQWKALERQAALLWDKPVQEVDVNDVLDVLQPIWTTKAETASRIRGRIEQVLSAAKARKLRSGENPAVWRGNLDQLLPRRRKGAQRHHSAMPYAEVPSFYSLLLKLNSASARALQFTILTAARTGETIGATWKEVDLENRLWTIPASRMKAGRAHRVPLSTAAVELLKSLKGKKGPDDFIVPGSKDDSALSNMAMAMVLRRMDHSHYTVHGFRSTFRDWAGDEKDVPREIIEQALAHAVGTEVERAYRRSDAREKRRKLMEEWVDYLAG
jgi:integrase